MAMNEFRKDFQPMQGRFLDRAGKAARDENAYWTPIVVTKKEIDAEVERLASLPQPANGRRESLIVHPLAAADAPGFGRRERMHDQRFAPAVRRLRQAGQALDFGVDLFFRDDDRRPVGVFVARGLSRAVEKAPLHGLKIFPELVHCHLPRSRNESYSLDCAPGGPPCKPLFLLLRLGYDAPHPALARSLGQLRAEREIGYAHAHRFEERNVVRARAPAAGGDKLGE